MHGAPPEPKGSPQTGDTVGGLRASGKGNVTGRQPTGRVKVQRASMEDLVPGPVQPFGDALLSKWKARREKCAPLAYVIGPDGKGVQVDVHRDGCGQVMQLWKAGKK